jgi:hypothetical protein
VALSEPPFEAWESLPKGDLSGEGEKDEEEEEEGDENPGVPIEINLNSPI